MSRTVSPRGRPSAWWSLAVSFALWLLPSLGCGQILFDATKAEMAGNADWVIDADAHDLRVESSDGSGTRGTGSAYTQSDPQRVPTPAISGITSTTKETYWQGALSAWAVALAKSGQTVIETLPVSAVLNGNGPPLSFTDANAQASGGGKYFYRARIVP